jgi:hypothetical protein
VLRNAAHDFGPRGVDQASQLFQMFDDMPCVFGSLAGRSHQHRALDGIADRNQWSDSRTFLVTEFVPE